MKNKLFIQFTIVFFVIVGCRESDKNTTPNSDPIKGCSILDLYSPPGNYVIGSEEGEVESFSSKDKLITAYYFYWYDNYSGAHIFNPDGSDALTDHPANMQNFSYKNADWHKKELLDMIEAGIDIVLPVYWGDNGNISWAIAGIEKLIEAAQSLKLEGINPPKIGMFYDTSSLLVEGVLKESHKKPDLTTDFGKEFFYKLIRDFFSLVPPELRARIDNKPYVQLYSAAFVEKHDQNTFNFADQHFSQQFSGNGLYIVREISWMDAASENVYEWGAALNGIKSLGTISIGPGYDDSAVPGRTTPIKERENGKFYIDNWDMALAIAACDSTKNIVNIETWNEFHEGTDICHSQEYGRKYIDITAEYAPLFKKGYFPENFPGKEFFNADSVFLDFIEENDTYGLTHIEIPNGDGKTTIKTLEGVPCLKPVPTNPDYNMYMYFQINSSFKLGKNNPIYNIKVEYYDSVNSGFVLEYDSKDNTAPMKGAYKRGGNVSTTGTNRWKTASFHITDARFQNRQNGCADFRLMALNGDLYIKRISVNILNNKNNDEV